MQVNFVAEVSSNHNRDIQRSKDFIKSAAKIGCSGVKFQLFKIDQLFASEILANSETHQKRREWELPLEFIPELSEYSHSLGLQFSCTPFYLEAVNELEPYVDFYKIASYELLWKELFIECVKTGKPLVFSTGMATIEEIKNILNVIRRYKTKDITILKCTSAYPTPHNEANLSTIDTLKTELIEFENDFNLSFGYSDHTVSPNVITRAVHHFNCDFIEFHLDIDGKGEEYSTGHCWLPDQIKLVIDTIRIDFEVDGNGVVGPTESEIKDRDWRADPADGLRPLLKIREQYI
jgi:sialic acid synthase SpsE